MSAVPVSVPLLRSPAIDRQARGLRRRRISRRAASGARPDAVIVDVRAAVDGDADAIYALIAEHVAEGHLLPRERSEIAAHVHRFIVAAQGTDVVACADLAPLSRSVAEVRSLVVHENSRTLGVGRRLVDELIRRASLAGFDKLCAFTHAPSYFVRTGFSIVPHVWLPEKIETDCRGCAQFRTCGQYAVMLPLVRHRQGCVPLAALHG